MNTVTVSHLETTYAAVPSGASVVPIGSWAMREVAVGNGNATVLLQASLATRVSVAGG